MEYLDVSNLTIQKFRNGDSRTPIATWLTALFVAVAIGLSSIAANAKSAVGTECVDAGNTAMSTDFSGDWIEISGKKL